MKKKKPLSGIFLAALPLLFQTRDPRAAFFLGGLIAFVFWATVFFFSKARAFFPRPLAWIAPLAWITAVAQCGRYLAEFAPRWILSLFLLLPFSFVKGPPRHFPKEPPDFFWIRRGLGFWGLLLYLGLLQELLGRRLGILIFQEPPGAWLLLGAALVLLPGLYGNENASEGLGVSKERG